MPAFEARLSPHTHQRRSGCRKWFSPVSYTHLDVYKRQFRSQWSKLQTGFVDEPRRTVEGADKLVAAMMQRLADGFANERSGLEKQWDSGDDVSTEDLRVALQRYRSFFDRLLTL